MYFPSANRVEELKQEANECFRQKQFQQAVQLYSKVLEIKEDSITYSNRAQTLLKLGRPADAYADTVKSLELDITNQKAVFRKSLALIELKRHRQAVKCLEDFLKLAPDNVEVQNLLKKTIQKSSERGSSCKQKQSGNVSIDRLYAFPRADFRVVEIGSTREIPFYSWLELRNYLERCHSKIRLVVFDGISLNRDAMQFFRAIDPICFSGEVHFNKIDFSPSVGLFEELFDVIITHVDIVQFVAPEGIRGYWFSEALCKCSGLRQANVVRVVKESGRLNTLSKGHKLDLDAVVNYLHDQRVKQCRVFITEIDFFRVSIVQVWELLVKKFEHHNEEVQYMLEIVCSVRPEIPAKVKYENRVSNEHLSLVVDLHQLEGKTLLDGGYRVLFRRYKEF